MAGQSSLFLFQVYIHYKNEQNNMFYKEAKRKPLGNADTPTTKSTEKSQDEFLKNPPKHRL